MSYIFGDIHEVIQTLPENSIDFIYTDPPFGITKATWDIGLEWDILFPEMWRVLKPNGVICLYASMPFTYELMRYDTPKYHYSWKKNNSTGFFTAKKQPLRCMEEIFIYYKQTGTYNPQMVGNTTHKRRNLIHTGGSGYFTSSEGAKMPSQNHESEEGSHRGRYPTTFKEWSIRKEKGGITRTDDQIDYFIKTYTHEGDTILDMTCHNKTVGKRCDHLNRKYIGVDIQEFQVDG
jgi:DNA modification methylase